MGRVCKNWKNGEIKGRIPQDAKYRSDDKRARTSAATPTRAGERSNSKIATMKHTTKKAKGGRITSASVARDKLLCINQEIINDMLSH